jgi:hypothetical protein
MEWISLGSSSIKIYVDGELVTDTTLKYPDISEASLSHIGKSVKTDNAFIHIPQETSFYGQMGMFALFGDYLSAGYICELRDLGFDYVPNFQEKE